MPRRSNKTRNRKHKSKRRSGRRLSKGGYEKVLNSYEYKEDEIMKHITDRPKGEQGIV